jgi:hypothetical protein
MNRKIRITADTPLSALVRKDQHNELEAIINMWRKHLINDDATVAALNLRYFEFDFTSIRPGIIYRGLAQLVGHDALLTCLTELTRYMATHSNLPDKWESVYRQIYRFLVYY